MPEGGFGLSQRHVGFWSSRAAYVTSLLLIAAAAAFLLFRFDHLPEELPVFISPAGDVLQSAPKSIWLTLRLPIMAVISLAAIALGHRATLRMGWTERGRAVVAGIFAGLLALLTLKMIPNALSIMFVVDGRLSGPGLALHYLASAMAVVGALLIVWAALRLRKSGLRDVNARTAPPLVETGALAISGLIYLAVVLAPVV